MFKRKDVRRLLRGDVDEELVALRARLEWMEARIASLSEGSTTMEERVAALAGVPPSIEAAQARIAALAANHAPVLWQDVGREPLPALPPIAAHLEDAAGDASERLAARARNGGFGTQAAEPQLAALPPETLLDHARQDAAPLPQPADRVYYNGDDHVGYWLSGLADALYLTEVAAAHDRPLEPGRAFLDFGCASGRVLRHVERLHPAVDLWGADISIAPLAWAREHLPARIHLLQGTLIPALPIPDRTLDVIFAGSVFTHVAEFEESLLHELARILRPGGLLLASIHPERAWDDLGAGRDNGLLQLLTASPHRAEPQGVEPVTVELFQTPMESERVIVSGLAYPINNHYTFHRRSWIERHWTAAFELVDIVEYGHGRRQDLVVLRVS